MPVDCEVLHGSATVTIEHLTGEVKPLDIRVGDRVPGGARNLDGRIIVKVCTVYSYCQHCSFVCFIIAFLVFCTSGSASL